MKKEYEFALKQHYDMQSERTQTMMKNSGKRTKKSNKKRRKGFIHTSGGCKSNKPVGPFNDGN